MTSRLPTTTPFPYTTLFRSHRWALELLEQLPVRALIATVWGEIEFIDPRLDRDLARRYPGLLSEDAPEHNLRTVLARSEEHTSELQSRPHLVCRLLLEKKKR